MENAYCDALKMSYGFENSSRQLYADSVEKVSNEFARHVLEFLAQEESDHIRKIEIFNESLLGVGMFDIDLECSSRINEKIQSLIADRVRSKEDDFTAETSDIDVYQVAMDMEKNGYLLYENALQDAESINDNRLVSFFSFMLEEEKAHYELLAQSKRYLEDSAYYFTDFGGWIFG